VSNMSSTSEVNETQTPKATKLAVFHITQGEGKSLWTKVGVAFLNRDGSLNVLVNRDMPKGAKLQVRVDKRS